MTISLSDLMKELQAGEEARAMVPSLRAEMQRVTSLLDASQRHAQELETNIIDYKRTIDGLNARVRSLEVERDDAGFRELETAERLHTLLSDVRGLRAHLGDAIEHVDPPKPEPVASPTVQPAPVPVTEAPTIHPTDPTISTNVPIVDHGQGQSVADPTANTEPTSSRTVSSSSASTTDTVSPVPSSDQSDPQPYRPFGGDAAEPKPMDTGDYPEAKRWYKKPGDMSTADWIVSGGQP